MKNPSFKTGRPSSPAFQTRALAFGISLAMCGFASEAIAQSDASRYGRNIDTRIERASILAQRSPTSMQMQQLELMKQRIPDMRAEFNEYGVVTSLVNPVGPIAEASAGYRNSSDQARAFVEEHRELLGLNPNDISEMVLADTVPSKSGVTHYYYRQQYKGITVYNAQMHVHLRDDGAVSHVSNGFIPELATSTNAITPRVEPARALSSAANALGLVMQGDPIQGQNRGGVMTLRQSNLSPDPIEAKLVWVPMAPGNVVLAWNFQMKTEGSWPNVTVDANTGALITSFDMTHDSTFHVYAEPVESPIHTSPNPPADARTFVNDPENALASPEGWFTDGSLLMRGNNVTACADRNNDNSCDGNQPQCTADRVCDFPLDLTSNPVNSVDAAIANLFYWNNLIHDVQYQYGFDEVSGNFQEDNFGRGGSGSDGVFAQAQDGATTGQNCNANFSAVPDGTNGRMQMYLCNRDNPSRDGSLDNGVIVHEYGHGISIRQVGGPNTATCLGNRQQAGEGWSDFFGLVYTADADDRGPDPRGLGSYLIAVAPDQTIRRQRYSTDPAINTHTYEGIRGAAVPHGVGEVWAQVLWEVYWALVDQYGFEENLAEFDLNDPAEAGNKRALWYVNEGLKNTSCGPTFLDSRDGVIAAASNSFGGEDVCTIWRTFAAFGMGTNAVSGGSNSTNPTNGFAIPAACDDTPPPPPITCPDGSEPLYAASFESGNDGWSEGASSCSTGDFVSGTPSQQADGTVITQVGGAAEGSSAWFTAPNSALGTDDVDGGTCETLSPELNLSAADAISISLSYFHGQRDAGDDAGDGFSIELLNNGSLAETLVSIGDVTNNAAWTPASTSLQNPGTVQLRVRATDGQAGGDLIEAGIDQVLVCATDPVDPPPPPPGECSTDEGFENGDGGWTNSSASTCSTGTFESGTPNEIVNGGVLTQPDGAASGTAAYYSEPNSGAGTNDVDGGNCIAQSPTYVVDDASTVSIAYFHGQRDAGDDANGDFFSLEMSTDGGNSFSTLVSNGDSTSEANWQSASAQVPAGSNVVLRMQCSDGSSAGDLIECGIDDVKICPDS